nr:MAG TPA: hypothetical protein [Caudoviricetes sp.]
MPDVIDGVIEGLPTFPTLVIAENVHLKRLALRYEVDAANRNRTNGLQPLVIKN